MSKKRVLSDEQIEEVRQLVVDGVQPQKIADQYHVGISTIHNYKRQFKDEGTQFASVRGRQSIQATPPAQIASRNNPGARTNGTSHTQNLEGEASVFVINGVSISIAQGAKSVAIEKIDHKIVFKVTI